ncbi:chemotaxis protein CheV [Endozoicomonas sp. SM1973]|uniref:Chemotaxis protein CheV n=1 Tax=Spartinivicinus marinus TaxID=2994442 RepID=A0A853HVM7_9GAMM|nr:chemotaxis protein [Spartinivicinus marinus]MCX4026635.1 chemotaxis protein [Spartinivicinus marinus]NYZ64469.1 chemotaxis protein CheV [Spartinivicinus marinus]
MLNSVQQSSFLNQQELLIFQLTNKQLFGINVLKIKEVIPTQRLVKLPFSHPAVIGIAKLRGIPFTVINLTQALGISHIQTADRKESIIITELNRSIQGFLVNHVSRIINCSWHDILPPPAAMGNNIYITGITKLNEEMVEIIDVEKVINEVIPTPDYNTQLINELPYEYKQILKNKLVVAVDDSSMARKQVANTLKSIGVQYLLTCNGKQAIEKIHDLAAHNKRVDMIISDIEMPTMDGYTLTQEIRRNANEELSSIYILLHTSLATTVSAVNATRCGANAALTKFVTNDLANMVIEALTKK